MRARPGLEWAVLSPGRRAAYAVGGVLMILLAVGIAWVDLQARRTGILDMALMGGLFAGGGFMAYSAAIGKEQRKVR